MQTLETPVHFSIFSIASKYHGCQTGSERVTWGHRGSIWQHIEPSMTLSQSTGAKGWLMARASLSVEERKGRPESVKKRWGDVVVVGGGIYWAWNEHGSLIKNLLVARRCLTLWRTLDLCGVRIHIEGGGGETHLQLNQLDGYEIRRECSSSLCEKFSCQPSLETVEQHVALCDTGGGCWRSSCWRPQHPLSAGACLCNAPFL